jgi:undecaprenyl-diphosphatase
MPDLLLIIKAIAMGLVEGLTEFLPVSSTGHLILFGHLIQFDGPSSSVFEIVIQVGAILAVVCVYHKKFWHVATSLKDDAKSRQFIGMLLVAFLPAAVLGLLLHKYIKEHLFNPQVVAISLIAGGALMFVIDRMKFRETPVTDVDDIGWMRALKIGFFQCVAMIPGVSRSGATIIGGLLTGLDRKTAAEFSFFLAVPTLGAAAAYDLYKNWVTITGSDLWLILAGFVSSFIFGLMAIVIFIRLVVKVGFTPFALYRIALGVLILISFR